MKKKRKQLKSRKAKSPPSKKFVIKCADCGDEIKTFKEVIEGSYNGRFVCDSCALRAELPGAWQKFAKKGKIEKVLTVREERLQQWQAKTKAKEEAWQEAQRQREYAKRRARDEAELSNTVTVVGRDIDGNLVDIGDTPRTISGRNLTPEAWRELRASIAENRNRIDNYEVARPEIAARPRDWAQKTDVWIAKDGQVFSIKRGGENPIEDQHLLNVIFMFEKEAKRLGDNGALASRDAALARLQRVPVYVAMRREAVARNLGISEAIEEQRRELGGVLAAMRDNEDNFPPPTDLGGKRRLKI